MPKSEFTQLLVDAMVVMWQLDPSTRTLHHLWQPFDNQAIFTTSVNPNNPCACNQHCNEILTHDLVPAGFHPI